MLPHPVCDKCLVASMGHLIKQLRVGILGGQGKRTHTAGVKGFEESIIRGKKESGTRLSNFFGIIAPVHDDVDP